MSFVFQLSMNNTDEEEPLQGERNQLPGLPASKIVVNTKTAKKKECLGWCFIAYFIAYIYSRR